MATTAGATASTTPPRLGSATPEPPSAGPATAAAVGVSTGADAPTSAAAVGDDASWPPTAHPAESAIAATTAAATLPCLNRVAGKARRGAQSLKVPGEFFDTFLLIPC